MGLHGAKMQRRDEIGKAEGERVLSAKAQRCKEDERDGVGWIINRASNCK
jgi:hypothetical protein